MQPEKNPVLRLFRRFVPTVPEFHGQRFTVVKAGKRYATPLLAVLVLVEATDLVFAVDSIPAVFAVTQDPFIVYTSNIFAILGLRAMFFMLAGVMDRFRYLKPGLAAVLVFVGAKMMLTDIYKIPIGVSLGVVSPGSWPWRLSRRWWSPGASSARQAEWGQTPFVTGARRQADRGQTPFGARGQTPFMRARHARRHRA